MPAAAVPWLIGASLAASTATTAYQIKSSNDAKNDAEDASNKQAADAQAAIEKQQQLDQTKTVQQAMLASQAQRRASAADASTSNRGGTISTSPTGVPGNASGGQKTLLGM